MIIFTPIRQIPVEVLEVKGIRQVAVYNLSSYYSDIPTLNLLIPSTLSVPEEILNGDCDTPEFDISYHNYILNDNNAFMQFMNIIQPVYTNPDVLVQILINKSEFRDVITESLIKLIQQRYGYNVYLINDIEDFIYADEPSFTIPGLFNMDIDLQKWQLMIAPESGELYE